MAQELTVGDLIADPILDTRLVAGADGLDRVVRWAQTSEMPDPWKWLGQEELLMTVGLNLPATDDRQRMFVRKAHAAGIAALAVGDDGYAPELSRAMRAEADRLGFPLLITGPDTPFVVIARTVAAANASKQSRSILILSRLYQAAARQELAGKRSASWVRELCGARVAVVDVVTGAVLIGDPEVPAGDHRSHDLDTFRPTRLAVDRSTEMDALTLIHLKQILAVDATVVLQRALDEVAEARSAVSSALDGGSFAGLTGWLEGGYRVLAVDQDAEESLGLCLALDGVRPAVARRRGQVVVVALASDLRKVRSVLSRLGLRAGVSCVQRRPSDIGGAADEARAARAVADSARTEWEEFAGSEVSLLARSVSEAESIVESVLGPLAAHPSLRESLFTLLDLDLAWQEAAEMLGIHRQTLAYRIRRVEELTGHSVRKVPELSELWLARKAWALLHEGG